MGNDFQGWYFKCQSQSQTVALIPAQHRFDGDSGCSLQVITQEGAWSLPFSQKALTFSRDGVRLGENRFSPAGLRLNLRTKDLTAFGSLRFGPLTPLRYDIMGPFRFVPFMECRHQVVSMAHSVTGSLEINGTPYRFCQDDGYIEGDRGRSFPKRYLWTQCCFPQGSLMLSVADIPFCGGQFTGIIAAVRFLGKEYRLATYLGARLISLHNGRVILRQGRFTLTAKRLDAPGHGLLAPQGEA